MGIVGRRAMFALLVFAAGWVTLTRNSDGGRDVSEDARDLRMARLTEELYHARFRWTALAARDTVLAWLSATSLPAKAPTVLLNGFPAGARAPNVDELIPTLWGRVGAPHPATRAGLMIYDGAGYREQGRYWFYSGSLLTERAGLRYCIGIAAGEIRPNGTVAVGQELLETVLAPCLIEAAFGPPGAGVGAWLDATRFSAARSAQWLLRPKEFVDGSGHGPWDGWFGGYSGVSMMRRRSSLRQFLGSFDGLLPAPPYHYGSTGVRCLAGNATACGKAVLGAGEMLEDVTDLPRDLTLRAGRANRPSPDLATVRPIADWFLSDVIREFGRERFGAFWRSDEPFERGFEQAFGVGLGEWATGWAARQWAASWEVKRSGPSVLPGIIIPPSWPILLLGWSGLMLLGAGWAATRRQTT